MPSGGIGKSDGYYNYRFNWSPTTTKTSKDSCLDGLHFWRTRMYSTTLKKARITFPRDNNMYALIDNGDENNFMKVNIALLTVTDTRTFDNDKSGGILVNKIKEANHNLIDRKICKDNKDEIVLILKEWLKNEKIDAIITTGGTGLTGRDITPEALDEIADKHIPGFGEVFRNISLKTVGTSAIQSRACAVLANGKYVFALPGSSGGVTDAWDGILKHQLDVNHKPCNFVELFPRLKEK